MGAKQLFQDCACIKTRRFRAGNRGMNAHATCSSCSHLLYDRSCLTLRSYQRTVFMMSKIKALEHADSSRCARCFWNAARPQRSPMLMVVTHSTRLRARVLGVLSRGKICLCLPNRNSRPAELQGGVDRRGHWADTSLPNSRGSLQKPLHTHTHTSVHLFVIRAPLA